MELAIKRGGQKVEFATERNQQRRGSKLEIRSFIVIFGCCLAYHILWFIGYPNINGNLLFTSGIVQVINTVNNESKQYIRFTFSTRYCDLSVTVHITDGLFGKLKVLKGKIQILVGEGLLEHNCCVQK